MSTQVETQKTGPVTIVTIARPGVRNAVDRTTAKALYDAFVAFDSDEASSIAVLTGADGTFCAGADLKAISSGELNRVDVLAADTIVGSEAPMGPTRLELSKPVIAAVEGYAVAGGLELALWCDMRVMARDAFFGVFCRRWGVPLIDGGTVRLPRLIGHSRAIDMILTGREIGAEEAMSFGLANRVVEPGDALPAAVALATELAALPQACLRSDRASAVAQWGLDLGPALAHEVAAGMSTIRSGETRSGATRFAQGAGRHGSSASENR